MSRRIYCDHCKAEIPPELAHAYETQVVVDRANGGKLLHATYDLCHECQERLQRRIPPWLWDDKDYQ